MDALEALSMVQGGGQQAPAAPAGPMDPMRALQIAQQPTAAGTQAAAQPFQPPTAADAFLGGFKKLGRGLASIGETGLQTATGIGATIASGLIGPAVSPFTNQQTGDVIRSLRSGMTYQPKIDEPIGRWVGNVVNAPADLYQAGLTKAAEGVRGAPTETGQGGLRDFLGTTLQVAGEAAPVVYGGVKSLTSAVPAVAPTVKQQTLKTAQDLGYVTTPEYMGKGTVLSGIAGKARVPQAMSLRNQEVTNEVALRDLNASMDRAGLTTLAADTELTPKVLETVRNDAGKAYTAVANQPGRIRVDPQLRADANQILQVANNVQGSFPAAKMPAMNQVVQISNSLANSPGGFTPSAAIEYVKQLRNDATSNLSGSKVTPSDRALATAQRSAADALENALDRSFTAQGKTDLVSNYQAARQVIAKTHTLEDALNAGSGDVSLAALSRAPYAGPELQKAINFYDTFRKVNQNPASFGGVQIASPLDAAAAVGGVVVGAATGTPAVGMLGAGLPVARNLALPYVMSKRYQRGLLAPPTQAPPILPLTPGLLLNAQEYR